MRLPLDGKVCPNPDPRRHGWKRSYLSELDTVLNAPTVAFEIELLGVVFTTFLPPAAV